MIFKINSVRISVIPNNILNAVSNMDIKALIMIAIASVYYERRYALDLSHLHFVSLNTKSIEYCT